MTRRGTRRQRKHQEERMAKKTQKFIKEMKIDMNMMKSKRMGSRKLRRYENAQLLYLSVDENDICEDYSDIAQTTETSLSKLFDNKENMEAWNTFIEKDEEDQRKYLENVKMEEINKQCCSCDDHSTLEAKILEHRPCQIHSYLPNTAFFGLNRRIRIMLKHKNLPLEFMTELENELRSFFCKNVPPVLEWSSSVLTRWQRFIIHTISDYLSLSSKSIFCA
ncbi:unnamed protein product [Thelazia callipaeda]|uniref:R3H-assoc domain-containing protein n=1 Tax=Thelazia callipaeda TaxID=103827 RepID=A0A0N5D6M5_THECL|nr:unnamed protein product [Thelazia callipaeda]